jgi:hypothetical protein
MALEGAAAGQADVLIPGLNFKLPDGASYISGRRFSTFFPQGSNIYSPNGGTRLVRFVISDANNLIDLSTIRLAFHITNTSNAAPARRLYLKGHPGMSLFQRVRIYVGGCLAEDILLSNRVASMLDTLKPPDRRWTESNEILPPSRDIPDNIREVSFGAGPGAQTILQGQRRTVITPIFSGLLATHYMMPGRFALTIELELVNNANQCCAVNDNNGNPLSQNFELSNVRLLADVVSVDGAVQEELSRVLLSGGALPLHFSSYSTTMHNLALAPAPNQSWSVTISRAFSRIKSVFITFDSDGSRANLGTESDTYLNWHGKPDFDLFGGDNPYQPDSAEGFRFQLASGSLLWPDLPISSMQEFHYQLAKVIGMHSNLQGTSIPPSEWLGTNFIIGLDLEKAATAPSGSAAFTGLSTRNAGDTLRFAFEGVQPRDPASTPQRQYVTIHFDAVLEMRAEGCILLD